MKASFSLKKTGHVLVFAENGFIVSLLFTSVCAHWSAIRQVQMIFSNGIPESFSPELLQAIGGVGLSVVLGASSFLGFVIALILRSSPTRDDLSEQEFGVRSALQKTALS